jgi:hypothetical protein
MHDHAEKHHISYEIFEDFRNDSKNMFKGSTIDDDEFDDFDDFDEEDEIKESASIVTEAEGIKGGKIFCKYFGWSSGGKDISTRDLKSILKDKNIDIDKIINSIKSSKDLSSVELGELNNEFKDIKYASESDIKDKKKNVILYYFNSGVLHLVEGSDRIVEEVVDKNKQITEDLNFVYSYQPKVLALINDLNKKVSNMRVDETSKSSDIDNLKHIIKRLTYLNQALLRFTNELNSGFNYYNSKIDKIDSLIAKLDHGNDNNLKNQIKDNNPEI